MRLACLAFLLVATASPALAHPKLLSASPAPNATAASTSRLKLAFSERLVAKFAGASLAMTAMPGMAMPAPKSIAATASVGPDGKTLNVALARPLAAGTYKLAYHVVSVDTHRVEGSYVFRVK